MNEEPASLNGRRIQAVLFDLDGTLRHNRPEAHHFFFDHAVQLGVLDVPENRIKALRWAHSYWNSNGNVISDTEKFGRNTTEFWQNHARKYLLAYGCSEDQASDLAHVMQEYMFENYNPVNIVEAETPGILQRLRDAGFTVGVVSNRDEPFDELLAQLGLLPHVDFTLCAGEANSWKPDTAIFNQALEMAAAKAQEAVYVGDNYYADILGARQAGLLPILIDPENVFPDVECLRVGNILAVGALFE